jgi:hypothetical protein
VAKAPAAKRFHDGLPFASRRAVSFPAWTLLVVAVACGAQDTRVEPARVDDDDLPEPRGRCPPAGSAARITSATTEAFALSTGLDFENCGREMVGGAIHCCQVASAGYDCLLNAFESCSPARFGLVASTIEGDPIFTDYFVKDSDNGCRLFVVTDNGQDAFRDMSTWPVQSFQCGRASLQVTAPDQCPSLALKDCGP